MKKASIGPPSRKRRRQHAVAKSGRFRNVVKLPARASHELAMIAPLPNGKPYLLGFSSKTGPTLVLVYYEVSQ